MIRSITPSITPRKTWFLEYSNFIVAKNHKPIMVWSLAYAIKTFIKIVGKYQKASHEIHACFNMHAHVGIIIARDHNNIR